MPLLAENNFLPDLQAIPAAVARKAKILWLNYPNNPTGAVAPLSFFKEVVDFARQNQIVVAHDAPYVDVCFDGYTAPSLLQIPGAKDVSVEFNSLSKTYNMAGWRIGMAVGNEEVVGLLHTYKSQADTAHFGPVITASIAAMTGDQTWTEDRNAIYKERRDAVVSILQKAGFGVVPPPAAIYVWARLPEKFLNSLEFCSQLLEQTGVSITPGIVYGDYGEGYIRVSLCTPTDRIRSAMSRMLDWMSTH
jgi:LL-diaminopimelate aminotransferase